MDVEAFCVLYVFPIFTICGRVDLRDYTSINASTMGRMFWFWFWFLDLDLDSVSSSSSVLDLDLVDFTYKLC
jgi:hypothetical protein